MTATLNPYASPETADLVQRETDLQPSQPKIFAFDGRLGRMRTVTYSFLSSLLVMLIALPALAILMPTNPVLGGAIYVAALIVSFIYSFSVYVRRLHDLDTSGLWSLLIFVPLVNIGLMIYLFFFKGTEGTNRYGAPTVPNSTGVIVGFTLGLVFSVVGMLAAISIPAYQDYVQRVQQAQMQ